ncbi:Golgi-associated plant pathogenesis-related protein 1-like [Diretmus argenteus]
MAGLLALGVSVALVYLNGSLKADASRDGLVYLIWLRLMAAPGGQSSVRPHTSDAMADQSFKQEFLDTHNDRRAKHSVPPMTLSDDLNASAQKWADYLLSIKTLKHSSTDNGENVYYASGSAPMKQTGKEAVESWYKEIKDYSWSSPGYSSNTGHFTQVVWKDSTELGVGMATDGSTIFVVGQYRPAGNMNGKEYFEKNVLPLAGRETGGGSSPGGGGGVSPTKSCTLL